MHIELGKPVPGSELFKAISFASSALSEIADCQVGARELYKYQPNSLKKVLDSCEFDIWPTTLVTKGFFKKRMYVRGFSIRCIRET